MISTDRFDLTGFRDVFFHAKGPVGGVDQQASQAGALKIGGGTHCAAENTIVFSMGLGVLPHPGNRHQRLVVIWQGVWLHAREGDAMHQHRDVIRQVRHSVDIGWTPDILDALENGVAEGLPFDHTASAFLSVVTMMIDPGFA